jgi:hypothetical protein
VGLLTSLRPAQATKRAAQRPARMNAAPRHVALSIAANPSAFASPMLRKKSLEHAVAAHRGGESEG